jgi:hypothetical protein
MKIRCLGVILCLVVAASAFAKGNANLEPLAGMWKCTGITFASPMAPEHATKATVDGTWIMGGKWLEVVYKEMKTTKNPKPIQAELLMSYDEALKKVVSGCVDNMGGYCTEETGNPPWNGDMMVLSGNATMDGQAMKVRDTFTKGSGWVKHMGEIETPKGWVKVSEETCKR